MSIDDSILVRCSRCKVKFRDKARRVREGYSRQCPSCERVMFFIEGSPNKEISDALKEAQHVRKLLRQEENEKAMSTVARAEPEPSEDTAESHSAGPRVRSTGRATIRSR